MKRKTGRVLLRARDVHGEPGAGDRDALPRAAHDSPSADAADSEAGRQGLSVGLYSLDDVVSAVPTQPVLAV